MESSPNGCSVLVVEDHPESAEFLARLLRMCGHRAATAHTARDALALAAAQQFDLLVCDIGLPDGNGCDVFRAVNEMYAVQGVALTGHCSPEYLAAYKRAGFFTHLIKPVMFDKIKAVLDQVCAQPASR